jgi:hypothetical protein
MSGLLAGATLRTRGGGFVSAASALRGKAVLLLYSSSWCPDCKPFCGKLKGFLAQVRSHAAPGHAVEVVWVSSDRTAEDAERYFDAEHEWLMIPFEDPLRDELKRKCAVVDLHARDFFECRASKRRAHCVVCSLADGMQCNLAVPPRIGATHHVVNHACM